MHGCRGVLLKIYRRDVWLNTRNNPMPNQPKEWWQEMVEEAHLLQLQKTSFPSGDMENWVSQKELIEFFPKLIAEADRRATVRTLGEVKKIVDEDVVVALEDEKSRFDTWESGYWAGFKNGLKLVLSELNSRIQQYGKENNT